MVDSERWREFNDFDFFFAALPGNDCVKHFATKIKITLSQQHIKPYIPTQSFTLNFAVLTVHY